MPRMLVDPSLVGFRHGSKLPCALWREADEGGSPIPLVRAAHDNPFGRTSRSMMPVTLPLETIKKRDSSVIVMPAGLRSSAAITSNFGNVVSKATRKSLAQLRLHGAGGAQQPEPQTQPLLARWLRSSARDCERCPPAVAAPSCLAP